MNDQVNHLAKSDGAKFDRDVRNGVPAGYIAEEVFFYEEQRFRQIWLWSLLFIMMLLQVYMLYQQQSLKQMLGDQFLSNEALWILWLLIGIGVPVSFIFMKLVTFVTSDYIYVRFSPFVTRIYPLAEVADYSILSGKEQTKANSSGPAVFHKYLDCHAKLVLTLADQTQVLLATRQPKRLAASLDKVCNQKKILMAANKACKEE